MELFVSLSVAGSTIVACMLLLRLISPSVLSTKWRYSIGKMAVGFYLLPVAFVLQWLWPLFIPKQTMIVPLPELSSSQQQTLPDITTVAIPEQILSADIAIVFLSVWATGAFFFAIWQVYCYRRFNKTLQQTRSPVPENSEAAKQLTLMKKTLGIQSNVQLVYSSAVRSPVLVGLWKPTIYLPVKHTGDVDMGMVIRHELIHLKQKDLWIKAFTLGASVLHWFNPFVYILRKDIHTWCELSCDEEVVQEMSYTERKRYGATILNVMEDTKGIPDRLCASLSGDGKQLKRRLDLMLNVKKMKKRTVIMAVAVIIAFGTIGTSTAIWASENVPEVQNETSSNDNQTLESVDSSALNKNTKVTHYYEYDALLPDEKELVSEEMALYYVENIDHLVPYEELTLDEQNQVTKEDGIYTSEVIEKIK
nr:M56 family metallopeptidase [Caldalkalibacillus salinus]